MLTFASLVLAKLDIFGHLAFHVVGYSCRELVIAYAAWISPAFHLKVIRVFLSVTSPAPQPRLSQPSCSGLVACLWFSYQCLCAWVNAPSVDMR
ncbi:KilA-N domain-containing protein [Burkholderia arboris]|uniref:KilA-N domain-containing protein n=1 Tax=Burkholderia arboris TaxID=488730 RepID=UPI001CF1B448|nr:KilA-N domain-containing protein [Burkholderia arboris]MCA8037137.1 KilA-N domain-containing protein [Burkholderia arboris]